MDIDQVTAFLREFGFPVVVALWFMIRLEKRLDRLFELMNSHMQATALLARSVDDHIDHTRSTGPRPILTEGTDP